MSPERTVALVIDSGRVLNIYVSFCKYNYFVRLSAICAVLHRGNNVQNEDRFDRIAHSVLSLKVAVGGRKALFWERTRAARLHLSRLPMFIVVGKGLKANMALKHPALMKY